MADFVYTIKYPKFDGRIISQEHILHNGELIPIKVVWDTGSTYTCISTELAKRLNLSMSDGGNLATSYGKRKSNRCHIDLILDNDNGGMQLDANVLTNDFIHEEKVDLLLGMDFIKGGDFAISEYDGTICFSFRYPSEGFIDFKEQEN